MRYTTIIDIRELGIYRNQATRLLYLHMVLASGYHESDLDQVNISIRGLATQTGLTVSATRHALAVLMKAGIVKREGDHLRVAKYVLQEGIPKKARTKKEQQLQNVARERERQEMEKEWKRYHEAQRIILESSVEELEKYAHKLATWEEGRTYYIKGVGITNNQAAREAIARQIQTKKAEK